MVLTAAALLARTEEVALVLAPSTNTNLAVRTTTKVAITILVAVISRPVTLHIRMPACPRKRKTDPGSQYCPPKPGQHDAPMGIHPCHI
jgi:hypothetical protein